MFYFFLFVKNMQETVYASLICLCFIDSRFLFLSLQILSVDIVFEDENQLNVA